MDIEQLRIFRDIILSNGFSSNSEASNISQSNLSRIVSRLEKRIGYKLIDRKPGRTGLELTPQGKILFDSLPDMLNKYDNLLNSINLSANSALPELTIYSTSLLIEDWLVKLLPQIKSTFSTMEISLIARDQILTVEEKKTLISISPRTVDSEYVCQVHLRNFHVKLWASEVYKSKYGLPLHVNDLAKHQLLLFAKNFGTLTYPNLNWHLKKINSNLHNVTIINSSDALIKACKLGLGIISLSEEAIKMREHNFINVLPEIKGPTVEICLSYPIYLKNNNNMSTLTEILVKGFSTLLKR